MPITQEIISKDNVLSALNDEQKAAIIALSANTETAAINNKFAEVHNELDAIVKAATGVDKSGGEKTSAYIERMLKAGISGAKASAEKINALEAAKKDLEEKLSKNGNLDEETKKKLADAMQEVESIRGQYNTLHEKYKNAEKQHEVDLLNFRMDGDFNSAMAGLSFNEGLNEQALATLKAAAIAQVKGSNPEYIDDGKGGKMLAFKDASGNILRNPENSMFPYTAHEMLKDAFSKMGILKSGNGGAGGAGGHGSNGGFGNARTQVEAMNNIEQQLFARGITRDNPNFRSEMNKIINDNSQAYYALPLK